MRKLPSTVCVLAWFVSVSVVGELQPELIRAAELSETEFRRLHSELQPKPDELWRTIPWKTSLLDAQREAATKNKPIFIWAMDGHPLGCT